MEQFLQINIGQIAQVVILFIGGLLAVQTMKNEIKYQGQRLLKIESTVEDLSKVVVQIARQEERLTAMDQRMLSQGRRIDRLSYGQTQRFKEQEAD